MRILWLKTGPLHPLDTGGKIRTCNMLRALRRHHSVTYLSLYPPDTPVSELDAGSDYADDCVWVEHAVSDKRSPRFLLEVAGSLLRPGAPPLAVSRYTSPDLQQHLTELAIPEHHDLLICDFLAPADNVLHLIPTLKIPAILFQHNVESVIWERLAETAPDPFRGLVLRNQRDRMRRFEERACSAFAGVITVSPEDTATHLEEFQLTNVLGDVPTGVDVPHFQEVPRQDKPAGIVFLGSMDWHANVDGVHWFVESVFSQIKQQQPDATFTIVGRRPPPSIIALGDKDPAITVTGTVDDVRPYLAAGEVLVVPLRVGGGTRIKIFEAMAAGIPVVSTRIGAEGLPAEHDRHLLLADESAEFAAATAALLRDPERAGKLAQSALDMVANRFTWQAVADEFTRLCNQVLPPR